jgi:hypothetical protein
MGTRRLNGEGWFIEKKGKPVIYKKQFGFKADGKPNIITRSGSSRRAAKARMDEYERSIATLTDSEKRKVPFQTNPTKAL